MKIEQLEHTLASMDYLEPRIGRFGGRYFDILGHSASLDFYMSVFKDFDGTEDPQLVLDLVGKIKKLNLKSNELLEKATPFVKLATKIRQFISKLCIHIIYLATDEPSCRQVFQRKYRESLLAVSENFARTLVQEQRVIHNEQLLKTSTDAFIRRLNQEFNDMQHLFNVQEHLCSSLGEYAHKAGFSKENRNALLNSFNRAAS